MRYFVKQKKKEKQEAEEQRYMPPNAEMRACF